MSAAIAYPIVEEQPRPLWGKFEERRVYPESETRLEYEFEDIV
jgi:hypothetical protein